MIHQMYHSFRSQASTTIPANAITTLKHRTWSSYRYRHCLRWHHRHPSSGARTFSGDTRPPSPPHSTTWRHNCPPSCPLILGYGAAMTSASSCVGANGNSICPNSRWTCFRWTARRCVCSPKRIWQRGFRAQETSCITSSTCWSATPRCCTVTCLIVPLRPPVDIIRLLHTAATRPLQIGHSWRLRTALSTPPLPTFSNLSPTRTLLLWVQRRPLTRK